MEIITSEFCRICLKNAPMFDDSNFLQSFSIYKKDNNNLTFADKIQILTKIHIPRSIPLAKRICNPCSEILNSAYNLIKKCEESDLILQKFIEKDSNLQNEYKQSLRKIEINDIKIECAVLPEAELADNNGKDYYRELENKVIHEDNDFNDSNVSSPDVTLGELKKDTKRTIQKKLPSVRKRRSAYKRSESYDESDFNDCDNDIDYQIKNEESETTSDDDIEYGITKRKNNIGIKSKKTENLYSKNKLKGGRKIKLVVGLKSIKNEKNEIACEKDEKITDNQIASASDRGSSSTKKKVSLKKLTTIRLISSAKSKKVQVRKRMRKLVIKSEGEKPSIICDICGKVYHNSDTMRGHMKWHENNEENFTCDVCGKGFETPGYLRSHRRNHFKRPCPYKCEKCPKSFYHPNKLRAHMKYHHTDDRLQCPHCDITVKYPSSLRRHVFKHTELKLFECIDCSKMFRSMSNLTQHLTSKFHTSKEIQPMVRIKGITQQYVQPTMVRKKLRDLDEGDEPTNKVVTPDCEENFEESDKKAISDVNQEQQPSETDTYEYSGNQMSPNYLVNNFVQVQYSKQERY